MTGLLLLLNANNRTRLVLEIAVCHLHLIVKIILFLALFLRRKLIFSLSPVLTRSINLNLVLRRTVGTVHLKVKLFDELVAVFGVDLR